MSVLILGFPKHEGGAPSVVHAFCNSQTTTIDSEIAERTFRADVRVQPCADGEEYCTNIGRGP